MPERICSGIPRHSITSDSVSITSCEFSLRATRSARHSRVYSSISASPQSSPILVAAVRDGAHVAVSVADEGRGVPPELLPQLFRKYSREAGAERARGLRGSGLGLAICKGLVEAHGGRIRAESSGEGRGTRFTFTLPVAGEAAAGALHSSSRPSPEGHEPTRILVVDDDPQTLRFVREVLLTVG